MVLERSEGPWEATPQCALLLSLPVRRQKYAAVEVAAGLDQLQGEARAGQPVGHRQVGNDVADRPTRTQ